MDYNTAYPDHGAITTPIICRRAMQVCFVDVLRWCYIFILNRGTCWMRPFATDRVAVYLSVGLSACLSAATVSPAKTAEPINILIGM